MVFFSQFFCIIGIENWFMVIIVIVNMYIYVFDNIEYWNFDFFEYYNVFFCIDQCDVLWGGDYDCIGYWNVLCQC